MIKRNILLIGTLRQTSFHLGMLLATIATAMPLQGQAVVQHVATPTPTPSAGRQQPPARPRPAPGRVVSARLSVAPTGRTVQCPATERFAGTITTNGPAEVKYTWASFDGGTWAEGTLHFTEAGTQKVSEQVKQGKAGEIIHGWMQLKVLSPNAVVSPRAAYTINCGGAGGNGRVIRATLTVAPLPRNIAARCPITEHFTGTITTSGPAEVKYTWVSFDPSTWPQGTLHFARAGTQTVRQEVTQSGNVHGWLQLKVESPNAVLSPRAQYVIRCPMQK